MIVKEKNLVLLLDGISSRLNHDCDVIARELPPEFDVFVVALRKAFLH